MSTLGDIWNDIKKIGYEIRLNNKDDSIEWEQIRQKYTSYILQSNEKLRINNNIKKIYEKHYLVGNDSKNHIDSKLEIDKIVLCNTKENDSYLIQCFKIPAINNFKISILQFVQIAYNIGQFEALRDKCNYDSSINIFYSLNCLGDAKTFISEDYVLYLDMKSEINGKIKTNSNFTKYMKYKIKYIDMKTKYKLVK